MQPGAWPAASLLLTGALISAERCTLLTGDALGPEDLAAADCRAEMLTCIAAGLSEVLVRCNDSEKGRVL